MALLNLNYDEAAKFNELFRPVVLADGKWTYEIDPTVARIVKAEHSRWESHWDSGQPDTPAVEITYWTGTDLGYAKFGVGAKDRQTLAEVCPDTWDKAKERWVTNPTWANSEFTLHFTLPTANYINHVRQRATNAHKIEVGCTVMVTKGRKVPKGLYEVTKFADGQYGPYVNLRDGTGKTSQTYNYVATGNVTVVPNHESWFFSPVGLSRGGPFTSEGTAEAKFIRAMFKDDFTDPTVWLVYADHIAEFGLPESMTARGPSAWDDLYPGDFADAVRHFVATEFGRLVVDKYDVEYHNDKRSRPYRY